MTGAKKIAFAIIFTALLFAVLVCGFVFGSVSLSLSEIIGAVTNEKEYHTAHVILFELRLPRILGAALSGAALSVSGFLLQSVTANELCAPNVIGVNAGAGFAVILSMCVFPGAFAYQPLFAFFGALITTFTVIGLCSGRSNSKTLILLSGVAVSALFNAGISFLSYRFPDVLPSYNAFSAGGFSGVRMSDIALPAVIIIVFCIAAQAVAPSLNLLCLGDGMARSLGVRVGALRIMSLVFSAALCAASVSFAGLVGFVGLIVPNAVRRFAGRDARFDIPMCVVCGAFLTVSGDLIGRVVFSPSELPAGIVMAAVGAPFFLVLLLRQRRENI